MFIAKQLKIDKLKFDVDYIFTTFVMYFAIKSMFEINKKATFLKMLQCCHNVIIQHYLYTTLQQRCVYVMCLLIALNISRYSRTGPISDRLAALVGCWLEVFDRCDE